MIARKTIEIKENFKVIFYGPESDLIRIQDIEDESESMTFYGYELEEILEERKKIKDEAKGRS